MKIVLFVLFFLTSIPAFATVDYRIKTRFENLNFLLHRNWHSINNQETFDADLEFIYRNQKNIKLELDPRARLDFMDRSRNRYIPNRAYFLFYSPHHELSGGLQEMHWGVSHAYNPTDILNRKDFEDNFYTPERLGEVLLSWKGFFSDFSIETFFFPYFQKSPLPERDTRFNLDGFAGFVPYTFLNQHEPLNYPESLGGALKLGGSIRTVDLSLHYYHGPEHDPGYVLRIDTTGALRLVPFYYLMDMVGLNLEAPLHDFKLHFEGAYKITAINDAKPHDINFEGNDALPKSYFQYVPGVDYTFHSFAKTGGNLLISLEYLGEQNHDTTLRNFRPFKNDLFIGTRLDFLDAKGTWLQLGMAKDLENKEAAFLVEFSSKIYRELRFNVSGVLVRPVGNKNSPLSYFDNNSYLATALSYTWGATR